MCCLSSDRSSVGPLSVHLFVLCLFICLSSVCSSVRPLSVHMFVLCLFICLSSVCSSVRPLSSVCPLSVHLFVLCLFVLCPLVKRRANSREKWYTTCVCVCYSNSIKRLQTDHNHNDSSTLHKCEGAQWVLTIVYTIFVSLVLKQLTLSKQSSLSNFVPLFSISLRTSFISSTSTLKK